MTRLRRLEIVGFRAFGATRQILEFEKDLALVYAPNSHGKTSLAEAIEFLLTGSTSRRELLGSAVREFADALRNAHLDVETKVAVRATVEAADGTSHIVERTLATDYSTKSNCTSELTIDGIAATNVATLGIPLAQSPLAAPILMPHGLRHIIQVEPTQRTTYFKMLLEMTDLDDVRRQIAGLEVKTTHSTAAAVAKYAECCQTDIFGAAMAECGTSEETVRAALSDALRLAATSPSDLPDGLDARTAYLRSLMTDRQGAEFPIDALRSGDPISWTSPPSSALADLVAYRHLLTTIDAELARVEALYASLLEIGTCQRV